MSAPVAPHSGGIEPGTSEVADAVASDEFGFYAIEGRPRDRVGLRTWLARGSMRR
jgi:phage replication-related protein YjqB (UPF0714/DUF867 family)